MFGLSDLLPFPVNLRPSARSEDLPTPNTALSRFRTLWNVLGLFSHTCLCLYSCLGISLRVCAVCRVSPFSTTVAPTRQQLLMSNAREHVATIDNGLTA